MENLGERERAYQGEEDQIPTWNWVFHGGEPKSPEGGSLELRDLRGRERDRLEKLFRRERVLGLFMKTDIPVWPVWTTGVTGLPDWQTNSPKRTIFQKLKEFDDKKWRNFQKLTKKSISTKFKMIG
jgi:hypothetical protein